MVHHPWLRDIVLHPWRIGFVYRIGPQRVLRGIRRGICLERLIAHVRGTSEQIDVCCVGETLEHVATNLARDDSARLRVRFILGMGVDCYVRDRPIDSCCVLPVPGIV